MLREMHSQTLLAALHHTLALSHIPLRSRSPSILLTSRLVSRGIILQFLILLCGARGSYRALQLNFTSCTRIASGNVRRATLLERVLRLPVLRRLPPNRILIPATNPLLR